MSDRWWVIAAVATALFAWRAPAVTPWPVVALVGVLVAVVTRWPAVMCAALALAAGGRAHASIEALEAPLPARVAGVAELVSDPVRGPFGTQMLVRIDGRRWQAEVPADQDGVVSDLLTGERVDMRATAHSLVGAPRDWVLSRHLAGRLAVSSIRAGPPPSPWYGLANVVHRRLALGSRSFDDEGRSLYLGLVIGDDREQSDLLAFRFRASGLAHLTAVSGQNVAFLLVVAGPILGRVSLRRRWIAIAFVLGLFVLVTRAEPSVLRAVAMSGTAAVAMSLGRIASGVRIISIAVMALVVVDPLLVHSIGFQLSVAASASLLVLARPLARRLPGPDWLTGPLAVTLAAQVGTAPLLISLSGGLPPLAVVANLLAVPAAGLVMMLGLTVGLAAGFVRDDVAAVVQWPTRLLVEWVDRVAATTSRVPVLPLTPGRLAVTMLAIGSVMLAVHRWRARPTAWSSIAVCAVVSGGLACVAITLWPPTLGPGPHPIASGVEIMAGRCGATTVALGGRARIGDVLDELWAAGIASADRVDVAGPSTAWAAPIAEQLGARLEPVGSADPCPGADDTEGAP